MHVLIPILLANAQPAIAPQPADTQRGAQAMIGVSAQIIRPARIDFSDSKAPELKDSLPSDRQLTRHRSSGQKQQILVEFH